MFWNKYPYTDFHELNLDWILQQIKNMDKSLSEFEALNKITFDGEWDITKQYPAWCIVNTNGGTEGYISIQPVPAGVVISNTDYWVSVVNYTATIADLQNRVVALENAMTTVNADITSINNRLFWNDKKIWCIGDSFAELSPKAWPEYLQDYTGVTIHKTSDGAAGYVNKGNLTNKDFSEMVADETADLSDYTDVVIVGGINDCKAENLADFQTKFEALAANIKLKAPNAKIWTVFNSTYFTNAYQTRFPYIPQIFRRIVSYAPLNDIQVLTSPGYAIQYLDYISSDGVHPKTSGSSVIARCIINEMSGGSPVAPIYDVMVHGIRYHLCEIGYTTVATYPGDEVYNDAGNPISISNSSFSVIYSDMGAPIIPKFEYQYAMEVSCEIFLVDNTRYVDNLILLPRISGNLSAISQGSAYSNVKLIRVKSPCSKTVPVYAEK